jgi:hypothetical protein
MEPIPIPIHFANDTLMLNVTVNTTHLDLPLVFEAETVNAVNLSIRSNTMSLPLLFEAEGMNYSITLTANGSMPLTVHIEEAPSMPLEVNVKTLSVPLLNTAAIAVAGAWLVILTGWNLYLHIKMNRLQTQQWQEAVYRIANGLGPAEGRRGPSERAAFGYGAIGSTNAAVSCRHCGRS